VSDRALKWLPASILAAAAALLALAWDRLPDRWVSHWGVGGRADGWAAKTPLGVFGPILIGAGICIVFEVLLIAVRHRSPDPSAALPLRIVEAAVAAVLAGAALWLPLGQPASPASFVIFTLVVLGGSLVTAMTLSARGAKSSVISADGWHGFVYRNPKDARLWVPKRFGAGWTLNFAHTWAWPLLLLLMSPALICLVVGIWVATR